VIDRPLAAWLAACLIGCAALPAVLAPPSPTLVAGSPVSVPRATVPAVHDLPRTTTVGLDARRRTADPPGTVPGGPPPHASAGARPPAGAAAPDDPSAAAGRQARYGWPLRPVPRIGQRFRAPPNPWSPGHRGVDLVGAPGQEVRAARDGVVAFAGPLAGRGVVSVLHPDGLRTTYEPVTATVAVGTVVSRGAVLGTLEPGHPGCPATACLHWGVRRGDADYLDPLVLVGPGRVRLLPDPGDGERP